VRRSGAGLHRPGWGYGSDHPIAAMAVHGAPARVTFEHQPGGHGMTLILVIVVVLLLFGGGGFYGYRSGYYGAGGFGGILGLLVLLAVLYLVFGGGLGGVRGL
jgi:hypothetical protein